MIEVISTNGHLSLVAPLLGEEERRYLEHYVDKLNRRTPIGFHNGSPVFSLYQTPLASKAGARALEMRLRRRFGHARFPASATLSVTKACQCACDHCSAVFYNTSARRVLSTQDLQEALRQTVALGASTIILLGGEPLLNRELPHLVSQVPADEATAILFTNGEYMTRASAARLKASGLMGAFVSLDSACAHEHDRLRRRDGLFDRALAGIESMQDAGLLVGISSYLSPEQLEKEMFERLLELGKRLGVHELTFFDAIPSGRWFRETSCLLRHGHRRKIVELVRAYRGKSGYPGLSVQSTLTSEEGSAFCFAANTQFYLTAFGDMCPCDFTPLSIGRFPEHSIGELWQRMIASEPYRTRAKACRMQDPDFHAEYLQRIPETGPFPYPIDRIVNRELHPDPNQVIS